MTTNEHRMRLTSAELAKLAAIMVNRPDKGRAEAMLTWRLCRAMRRVSLPMSEAENAWADLTRKDVEALAQCDPYAEAG